MSARCRVRRALGALIGFALAPMLALSAGACRQILGLDDVPPDVAPDAGVERDGAADGPTESPFEVFHGPPEGETLLGIWGTSPSFFVAVGTSTLSYFYRDGMLTKIGGSEIGRDYMSVCGFSEADIYAVGQSPTGGFVEHFDGKGWTAVFATTTPLLGAWCSQDGHAVFAVGAYGKVFSWYPLATEWTQLVDLAPAPNDPKLPDEPRLWSIAGASLDDFAIAAESRLYHWEPDAGGLAYYDLTTATSTLFRALWYAPDPTTSIYIGMNFYGLGWFSAKGNPTSGYPFTVLSRDESAEGGANSFIQSIWGTAEKVIAVGDHGRIYAYDTGSATPSSIPSPTEDSLAGVWGSSLDDVWIVGRRELILHGSVR